MRTIREMESELKAYKDAEKSRIKAEKGRWRRFGLWLRYFFVSTWKWLFMTLRDWVSWLVFGLVALTVGSTVWVGFLLYWIFGWEWALAMGGGSLFFWNCVPFTPFIPICLLITVAILKYIRK